MRADNAVRLAVRKVVGGWLSTQPALLVLAESYYPGWRAWIDEQPVPVYEVDLAFRGVVVGGGSHRLRMEFQPAILPVSIAITLATALALVVMA